jgi:hypothetical protein
MKALTLKNSPLLLTAIFACLVALTVPQRSFAEDTKVTCTAPQVLAWYTGFGATPNPQVTIDCTGGSSAGFHYYAFLIKDSPTLASMIPVLVGNAVLVRGTTTSITIYSDLSDISGNAWGCGSSNCRIIDQVWTGY